VKVLGNNAWCIALYRNSLWHIPIDPMPWGTVKKFVPGPTPPTED
jgi:hypothetical protein